VSKKFFRVSFKVERVDVIDERTLDQPAMSGEIEVNVSVRAETPEGALKILGEKIETLIAEELDRNIARRSDRNDV